MDVLGSSVSEGFETKNETHKMFSSVTLYTSYLLIDQIFFICLLFYSLSTNRYLCYDNDIIVKDGAGQEIQATEFSELSDFPLRNNPNTVI